MNIFRDRDLIMSRIEKIGVALLRRLEPEMAHDVAIRGLSYGLFPKQKLITSDRLRTSLAGLELPNPIGLAAGFDKNANALNGLSKVGFGFAEIGAATPRPQQGNPKPRLFRLNEDFGVINRLGFNNDGMDGIGRRLMRRPNGFVVGLNLGANKDSKDRVSDFIEVLKNCGPYVDCATVNVSSPNTESLRDLQSKVRLNDLLGRVMKARDHLPNGPSLFLKIAPDLCFEELTDIADVALLHSVDAIIATNTTVGRPELNSPDRNQHGGLSGRPLFDKSTRVLAQLSTILKGRIPLVGVGGISSAFDAYTKICAGASAVQLYTAFTFEGFSLLGRIASGLDEYLAREGFENVRDAVGSNADKWL